MTQSDVPEVTRAQVQNKFRDPSLDYPPSRPTWRMLLAAAVVIAVAVVLMNWPQVSAFAHISQIQAGIERAVGL